MKNLFEENIGGREMTCKACIEREKYWNGGDPICASDGDFNDNWMCATLNKLREALTDEDGWHKLEDTPIIKTFRREDQTTVFVDLLDFDPTSEIYADSLFVTWYKRRGETENVLLLFNEGKEPKIPTEEELLEVIEWIKEE